jgi:AraC family transcriptional regulator, regulatory protein of adaptative response / DNA-3-methyladenine glycosylase II
MNIDTETCYKALAARDVRFDGLFFVGVTTTSIYCRPICPARTPRADRCRFFPSAAAAERNGFRPCLRCRPELAPGQAPVDAVGRTARLAAARIEAGALDGEGNLETLARELGISTRQLRRVIRHEFGVSPVALAQTRRLLLAKQLLTETSLPLIEVALASGFASVRRFNALFRSHYALRPSRMRRAAGAESVRDSLRLTLAYRPPLAWDAMLQFLAGRATAGVECALGESYLRTIALSDRRGWIKVSPVPGRPALAVELSTSLVAALPALLPRLRCLFDLDARPDAIASHLGTDPRLAAAIARLPGLRVPGCVDGFELAVRAILSQRSSVAGATTLAGRLAMALGEPIATPFSAIGRLSPTPEAIARVEPGRLVSLGIAASRAVAIIELARAVLHGQIQLQPGPDPEPAIRGLKELPGIGQWTAHYIAMRALRWPDAFPAADLGLLRASGAHSSRALAQAAMAWRPWRSYAAMLLWNSPVSFVESPIDGADHLLPSDLQPDRHAAADIQRRGSHRVVHD